MTGPGFMHVLRGRGRISTLATGSQDSSFHPTLNTHRHRNQNSSVPWVGCQLRFPAGTRRLPSATATDAAQATCKGQAASPLLTQCSTTSLISFCIRCLKVTYKVWLPKFLISVRHNALRVRSHFWRHLDNIQLRLASRRGRR